VNYFKQNQSLAQPIRFDFYLDLFGNLALFIPYALALKIITDIKYTNFYLIFQIFCFSVSIELIQYYCCIGVADIDDVILNTVGGLMGILLFTKSN